MKWDPGSLDRAGEAFAAARYGRLEDGTPVVWLPGEEYFCTEHLLRDRASISDGDLARSYRHVAAKLRKMRQERK